MAETRYKDPDIHITEQHPVQMGTVVYTVETLRYIPHERDLRWKLGMIGALVVLVLFCIWTTSWTMLAALLVFAWVYYDTHSKSDDHLHAPLYCGEHGISYLGLFYPYAELDAFAVVIDPDVISVHIKEKRKKFTHLTIYITDLEALPALRTLLKKHITEQEIPPRDTLHRLIRWLKL